MSGLVPVSKVTVIVTLPLLDDADWKYSSPSMPVSDCSTTWVTAFWIVWALAPG